MCEAPGSKLEQGRNAPLSLACCKGVSMVSLPMAVPFVVLVLAAIVAIVGLRKVAVWIWFFALAVTVYVLQSHITDPLKIAL